MPLDKNSYNLKLYNLLKTRGYRPIPLDSKGERSEAPQEADVFKFTFSKDDEKVGTMYATVEEGDIVLYYDEDEVSKSSDANTSGTEFTDSWIGLVRHLKHWAMTRQLGFRTEPDDKLASDMAQREYMKKKENIIEGYYPMGKSASYNDAVPTVKIILQHTRQIQEGEQRFRHVNKIFLENSLGERILAPTIRPGIAQVYARHLAEGGIPNDERWNHIKSLCEDYTKMAGFVRAVKNNQFNESAQQLVNEGVNHYQGLRETLGRMRGHRGYNAYFESWTPTLMEDESSDNTLNELFVQETLDPRIESVLPILSKLRKTVGEMKEVNELAEWAEELTEAPGSETLAHNEKTEKQRLDAFDLEESDDAVKAGQVARDKIKKPAFMRKAAGEKPATLGDVERSQQHRSSQAMVGQKGQEVEESGLQAYLGNKKYGKDGMDALRKAGRDGASKEKMASIRAKYDKLDEEGMMEVSDTDVEMKLAQLTKAPDIFDAIYDALTGDDDLGKYLQDMYIDIARESRLHPDDDFEVIITRMADQLEDYYGKEGVAEGSEQTNESLDRLLHLANINNPKKKVDESVDDMFSLSGKVPPTDRIDRDSSSGQDIQKAIVDKIEQQTINRLLDKYPNLNADSFKSKTLPELIQMLREQGVSEMDNRTPAGDRREQRAYSPEAQKQREKELQADLKKVSPEMRKKLRLPEPKEGVAEGSGPKEKQKTPYRDINSPEYRKAADKQKQQMAKDAAAEPGKKLADKIAKKGVAEGSDKLKGTPVVSLSDFDNKDNTKNKYGQTVPKKLKKDDPRVKFHKEPKKQGVAEARVDQLPTKGADYSKYDTDHLKTLLKPGILHRNEARFKALIRKELQKRQQQGVAEDLDANQKRVGQLGPTEKVKNNNIGKLVGASESIEAKLKAITEMDKSQPSSDRGGESSGDPYAKGGKATPAKAKDAAKDAEDVLNTAMDKAHKKDVKEGQEDLDAILRIIRR